ncbi:MAG: MMPL family transporter [Microbacteriaceae bacterium]|nr:MMPL family transporter [Microbacteriaceae bacterium]
MAKLLQRLGKFSATNSWKIIAAWLVILLAAGGAFIAGFGKLSNSFDIPGTPAAEVIDRMQSELPELSGAVGYVVYHTADGSAITAEQATKIREVIAGLSSEVDGIANVVDPYATAEQMQQISAQIQAGYQQINEAKVQIDAAEAAGFISAIEAEYARAQIAGQELALDQSVELYGYAQNIQMVSDDGSVAMVTVSFKDSMFDLDEGIKNAVMEYFEDNPVTGVNTDFSNVIAQSLPGLFGVSEAIGLAIAAIVLLVMLGGLIAASLPIATALVGVGIGALTALSFSSIIDMASVTPILGVMLGLAVGIDYSLFIVNRHRKQLASGMDVVESIALANGTAGNAVVFAGSTVIVALLGLNITGISFLGLMGNIGAGTVAIAVLIAITLTPALLGLAGRRVLNKRTLKNLVQKVRRQKEVKPMNTWRALGTIIVAVAALGILAIPAAEMRLGLPDGASEPADSTAYAAYETMSEAFGAGTNGALIVLAELDEPLTDETEIFVQLQIARELASLENVTAVAPAATNTDRNLIVFQIVPADGPNAASTDALVKDLRSLDLTDEGITLGVSGQTAINRDISDKLADVLPTYLILVVGLSLLIMILVFRSILVPVIATLGFVLSLLATYGALVAVFQWGWLGEIFGITAPGPIMSFLPIILVGILFGLAMDYQIFLAAGMREAFVHGTEARKAVAQGFRAGRAVVIAAALIMISVFGGFVFADSMLVRSVGFGLAVGVLFDAFIVRLLLMPALMHVLGKGAWWIPKWLDRILPDVDVEGAALEKEALKASV